MKLIYLLFISILTCNTLNSQNITLDENNLKANGVNLYFQSFMGKATVKATKNSEIKGVDQPTYVRINGKDFKNGTIEVSVLSKLLPNAGEMARGFIGIAFRINEDNSKFECIYIRPANGRSDDQIRRNHSIQYFSYPGYDFATLRETAPGKYESYSDMALNEWIKLKIVVKDSNARLFINDSKQPALIVNDLKHGPDLSGAIGLWVDVGTEGYFSDLNIFE